MAKPANVEAYLVALPAPQRAALEALRGVVRAAAPEAAEGIAYGIPTYTVDGRMLCSIAAFSAHCSLFPASTVVRDSLGDALAPYFRPKSTLRFPMTEPMPLELVRAVVEVRRAEVGGSLGRQA